MAEDSQPNLDLLHFELPKKCKSSFPSTAPMSNNLSPCLLSPLLRKDRERAVKCLIKKKKKSECCLLNFLTFLNTLIREKKRDGSIRNPSKIKKTMILYWLLLEIHLQPLLAKIKNNKKNYSPVSQSFPRFFLLLLLLLPSYFYQCLYHILHHLF